MQLSDKGARLLRTIAKELVKIKYGNIYIEGHTDSRPVLNHRLRYVLPTNWEFSVMRASRVARFLSSLGLKPKKLIAAGRGPYLPRSSNATPIGRSLNRRIEILITPELSIEENRNRVYATKKKPKDNSFAPPKKQP